MALLFAHDARMHAACPPRSHSERGNARGHTLRESHIWNGVMWNRVGLDAGFRTGCGFRARPFRFQDGFQDSCVTILSESDGRTVHTLSDTTAQLARRFLGMADAHTLLTADMAAEAAHDPTTLSSTPSIPSISTPSNAALQNEPEPFLVADDANKTTAPTDDAETVAKAFFNLAKESGLPVPDAQSLDHQTFFDMFRSRVPDVYRFFSGFCANSQDTACNTAAAPTATGIPVAVANESSDHSAASKSFNAPLAHTSHVFNIGALHVNSGSVSVGVSPTRCMHRSSRSGGVPRAHAPPVSSGSSSYWRSCEGRRRRFRR